MLDSIRYQLQPTPAGPPPMRTDAAAAQLEGVALDTPVLVVEDETLIAWLMKDLLKDFGFTDVRLARGYNEALALAAERHPGLLICDINLGGEHDGIEAAAAIRQQGVVPAAFITGYAGGHVQERIEAVVGRAPLLRKPIQPDLLAAALRALLAGPRIH